jgi:hypothetical protein
MVFGGCVESQGAYRQHMIGMLLGVGKDGVCLGAELLRHQPFEREAGRRQGHRGAIIGYDVMKISSARIGVLSILNRLR